VWRAVAERELRGRELESLDTKTPEEINVKPLYTAADTDGLADQNTVPGSDPFVRGIRATMYTGRPWTIRVRCCRCLRCLWWPVKSRALNAKR